MTRWDLWRRAGVDNVGLLVVAPIVFFTSHRNALTTIAFIVTVVAICIPGRYGMLAGRSRP